jgi:hypothetical protein
MGVESLFLGYIQEAWPGVKGNDEERQHKRVIDTAIKEQTDRVLAALPDEDHWPPLCKPMFGWPAVGTPLITYKNRVIHFAGSLKNADFVLRDWLDKFESLLSQLYWEEAYVRVEKGYIGTHEFRWKPQKEWTLALCSGRISPILTWDFTTTLQTLESLRDRNSASRPPPC